MKICALIPARISSKRLPRKNIQRLDGNPLLFWTINAAIESDVFQRVYVSTESTEIEELIAGQYSPSQVSIVKRPEALSTDTASLNDVCTHLLDKIPGIDVLSLMMPTYPFRSAERIANEIVPALYSRQIDRVVSVRYGSYSTFDYWKRNSHGLFERMYMRQPLWCSAGSAAYSFQKRDYFFTKPHKWPVQLGERTLRVQTDFKESIDIDTQEDFDNAEKVASGFKPKFRRLERERKDYWELVAPKGVDFDSFCRHLSRKGVKPYLPTLVLRPADPLFTFLRWYECNSSHEYYTEDTQKIIADLPASGHSQDFPTHYVHSPCYRILRTNEDSEGVTEETVPASQVIFEEDLKQEWSGYIEPMEWIAPPEPQTH